MNNKAFSLVELIVWITISMILMVSVWVFVSGGMQNIFGWQKILENTNDFINFSNNLNKNLVLIQTWSFPPTNTSSGIIFKISPNFSEGWFTYIWTKIIDQVYCESGSQDSKTNNIFIKNFIPFEEQWENTFTGYTSILSSNPINFLWKNYKSFQKEHGIAVENWLNWDIVVWKWIFWDKFAEGTNWTGIYLNSPTWLATDWTYLYISDTLNSRILYLDNSNKIHLLLDETDGLNEPTWLYYDDNTLYIANSWNWKILKYSSKSIASNPTLTLSWVTQNIINKIELSFFNQDWTNKTISWSTNKNDITFSNNIKNITGDYMWITANKLQYYFVKYDWLEYSEPTCILNDEKLVSWNPIKCINTSTWKTSTYQPKNLINEIININNISPYFSNTWAYYVNLKLFSWVTEKYSEYFPYFTQSDNNLTTFWDNTLTVLHTWLNYPTWIWWTWATDFNVFWDWTYSDLQYESHDYLLNVPIKSLNITNTPNDLITIILKYYRSYNCYNLDEKVEKTFIAKKSLK